MSSQTRSTLKLIAIILVIFMVLMQLNLVIIPALAVYKFWVMVGAFILLLVASS
ncbi:MULTISPECIES: hypothetical protein [Reichenbachiella]|uniref:Uncharacterized protein n=1 Tax=Reichenbachiella agariperforans TaxID=156994 RepID=A0A1M6WJT2_REIAG|nr:MULTISPECIES: hypothetical protein [Reichenbachiella]MBU2912504.1 hypothetical protein [Reichenbachiella agariperforans]SHK94020.1 hypothetical protein SAMN04488028_11317 [Reichenbachiella agariperforans]